MNQVTLDALARFPDDLEAHYRAIPKDFVHWTPASWDGIPSEHLTPIEQLCHVRDIEIDGYQARIDRMLREDHPTLGSIDTEGLAIERSYGQASADEALALFRTARAQTLERVRDLGDAQFSRTALFEGYGNVTLRGLLHYLCSHDQQHLAGLQWLLGQIDAARSQSASISSSTF